MKLVFYLLCCFTLQAWARGNDSLTRAYANAKHDTTRLRVLSVMVESENDDAVWPTYNEQIKKIVAKKLPSATGQLRKEYLKFQCAAINNSGYLYEKQDKIALAIDCYLAGIKIREILLDTNEIANNLNKIAILYESIGNVDKAQAFYLKSIQLKLQTKDWAGLAETYNNAGKLYRAQGNIIIALQYLYKSLALYEKLNDKKGTSYVYSNLSFVYYDQSDTVKAYTYLQKSILLREKLGDNEALAISYNNLGTFYDENQYYDKALIYYNKSLVLFKKLGFSNYIANIYNNLGVLYRKKKEYRLSLDYLNKALTIVEKSGEQKILSGVLLNLGKLFELQNEQEKAKECFLKSLTLSQKLGYPENIRNTAQSLYGIYRKQNNYLQSLQMHELYMRMRDSINNVSNQKALIKNQYQYDYDKKTLADSLKNMAAKKITDARLKQEKTITYSLLLGLGLVLVFTGILFNRFKITQKQKNIIEQQQVLTEEQRQLLAEKNNEINQSIRYAKHIQTAIEPAYKINELISDSFLLYQPKDVVSGDFYWLEKKEGKLYFGVADCTGHGIPGAFMTALSTTLLNETFNQHPHQTASDIVSKLNYLLKITFKQHIQNNEIRDGLDIAFCILDTTNLQLQYAGANRPLWIVSDARLTEWKADKQAIGGLTALNHEFTNHVVNINKGDCIYLTSDGYADQFGGIDDKKIGTKKLKQMLESYTGLSMQEQGHKLKEYYSNWKKQQDQVDDVTVIGIRV